MDFMVKFASEPQICTFLHRNFRPKNSSEESSGTIRQSLTMANRIVTVAYNNDPSIASKM